MKIRHILTAAVFTPAILYITSANALAENRAPAPNTAEVTTTAETTTTSAHTTTATTSTTTAATTTAKPDPPADLILRGQDTAEAGAEITLEDFIAERNVELKDGTALLDTSQLGTVNAEIPYLYNGAEFTQTVSYRVTDTTKPYIFNRVENAWHKAGKHFNLSDYIGYGDCYDPHPVLTYEGEIDPETVGEYPLAVTVTDSSGNAVSWDVTIHVAEEIPKKPDRNPRVDYSDFVSRYQDENVRFGIDVSAWQTDIDYNAVRDAGCSFVIIRVGTFYRKIKQDIYFRQNLENAAAAGLDVGVYIYTAAANEDAARANAQWIAEQLGGQKLDLPIVFDWEEFDCFQQYGLSIRGLNDAYAAFADEVTKLGYTPMLYGSRNLLNEIWSERAKALAPVWLAHYTDETNYVGEYAIWQQSAYGRIPGIEGDVDMDILYLDSSDFS